MLTNELNDLLNEHVLTLKEVQAQVQAILDKSFSFSRLTAKIDGENIVISGKSDSDTIEAEIESKVVKPVIKKNKLKNTKILIFVKGTK